MPSIEKMMDSRQLKDGRSKLQEESNLGESRTLRWKQQELFSRRTLRIEPLSYRSMAMKDAWKAYHAGYS